MEEKILSIVIMDFDSKIHFFQKRPEIPLELIYQICKNLSHNIKSNYLQDYLNKQAEFKLMDTSMTPNLKVKVSLVSEICIIVLYTSLTDHFLITLHNQRMIEAIYNLCKTKKINIALLLKRSSEVNMILIDTIYFLNPRARSIQKNLSFLDVDIHNIYFEKYSRATEKLRGTVYNHSLNKFQKMKGEMNVIKQHEEKGTVISFGVEQKHIEVFRKSNELRRERNGVIKAKEEALKLKQKDEEEKLIIVNEKKEIEQLKENKEEVNDKRNNNKVKEKNDNCEEQQNECELKKENNNEQDIDNNNNNKELFDCFEKENNIIKENENNEDVEGKKVQDEKQEVIENNNKEDMTNFFQFNEHFDKKVESSLPSKNINENIFEFDNNNNNQNKTPQNPNTLNFNFESFETKIVSDNFNSNNNDLFTFNTPTTSQLPLTQNEPSQLPIFDFDFMNNTNNSKSVKISQPSTDFFSFPQPSPPQSNATPSQFPISFDFPISPSPSPSLNFPSLTPEDKFDSTSIHQKLRCSIMEKGVLINTKGSFENITFRGHIDLELSSFHINNKTLFLSVQHPKWNDNNFFKKANYNNLITNESKSEYELLIKDISSNQRILEYTPNLKIIEPAVNFDVKGSYNNEEYTLRIVYQLTKDKLKNSSLLITIITKSNEINISDSTDHTYIKEDKKIIYKFDNFSETQKNQIGLKFHTKDECFVENVRVTYKYIDSVPSGLNASLKYKNEQNELKELNVVKRCMVEIKFTP